MAIMRCTLGTQRQQLIVHGMLVAMPTSHRCIQVYGSREHLDEYFKDPYCRCLILVNTPDEAAKQQAVCLL